MIVVKLMGGLGNQMFQYAAAYSLALRHNTVAKVDVSFLNKLSDSSYTQRKFELDKFSGNVEIASEDEMKRINSLRAKWLYKISRHLKFTLSNNHYFTENGLHECDKFKALGANTYLDGYWQNECYFKEYKSEIQTFFKPRQAIPIQLESLKLAILKSNAVSIHVRRGDYVTLKSANEFHGVCSIEYYKKAVDCLASKFHDLELFVFSDDMEWCKHHFNFNYPVHYVQHAFENFWDLVLMSYCKHNIIANSSFSWWAAWLNQNPDKLVIAPDYWYASQKSRDVGIVCSDWITL